MNKLGIPNIQTLLRSAAVAGLLGSTILVGCAEVVTSEQRQLAPEPQTNVVFENAATQPVRDYDQTTSQYANGDTVTDTTGTRYGLSTNVHPLLVPVAETGVFLANVVMSPVTAYQQRGGVLSSGPQFPPTHTAMPPLPASEAQIQQMQPNTPSTQPAEMTITTDGDAPRVVTTTAGLTPAAELSTTAFAIVGHVQFPGRYEVQENLSLAQAIVAAGLVEQDGTKVIVKIERLGEEPSSATLSEILGGQTANPQLLPGDAITISVKE
jgi:hypothetical protein